DTLFIVVCVYSVPCGEHNVVSHVVSISPWFAPVMTLKTTAALRYGLIQHHSAETIVPGIVKVYSERIKKKLKKMEKAVPELIPIEDFIVPVKYMDETRIRSQPHLTFEEKERQALLLKEFSWRTLLLTFALIQKRSLRLESEELNQAALTPDPLLFPYSREGPAYTPA
uniref:Large ribosomal subunit protein mL40 n=1 Tax=Cynoglossus semilaevis TaxID=244447 RepID=A0A3P8VY32_CYNSE